MNKFFLYLIIVTFFFTGSICKTQDLLNLYTPVYLYKTPHIRGEKLGVFTTSGMFMKLKEVNSEWWQVEAENDLTGYIQGDYAKKNTSNSEIQFPDFEKKTTADGQVLSLQLYVQVTNLAGRSEPESDAAIIQTFKINTPVEVDFLPYKEDAWVNVGVAFKGKRIYVQRKYLGKRLEIDSLISAYSKLEKKEVEARKEWADKIFELGKNKQESYENNITALTLYLDLQKELGNPVENKEIEEKLEILKYLQNSKMNKDKYDYLVGNYLELNGKVVSSDEVGFNIITGLKLPYKKSVKNMNICKSYADAQYIYDNFILYMKSSTNKGYIYKVDLSKTGNAFVVSDFKIDNTTTEKDFIEQVDSYFYTDWVNKPHEYIFYIGESGYITLKFENGKAKWYQVDYYC